MRVLLAAVLGLTILLSAQSVKDKKVEEIDKKIAELQKEIEGLQALKSVVSSGQLPESAINQIVVGSSAAAKPSTGAPSAPATANSNSATTGQAAASPSTSSPKAAAQGKTSGQTPTASGTPTGQTTTFGQTIYEGPRGGRYHYSSSGKKVYERKK
jgi:deoxyribose-phosphate aldolase